MANRDVVVLLKKVDRYFLGLGVLVFAVLALVAVFTDSISVRLLSQIGVVFIAVALVKTYFGWVPLRLGTVFVASVVLLTAGAAVLNQPNPKEAQYQAVFLTNGQVYFGHLEDANSKSPVLRDIYYLQSAPQNPQQSGDQQQQPQLSLVKLGQELHGPEDKMVLKGDQILFWEDLKNDSKVVQTINQSKNQ